MSFKWRIFAFLIAAGGGVLGVLGAVIQELTQGLLLAAFVAAPMIEEVMKPSGVSIFFWCDGHKCSPVGYILPS
ncbi:hypothetical protein ACFL4C_03655 [Candidatus Omnitrophota bacterium]